MHDLSQNGEGRIIAEYFGDRVGSFLSLGENDGVTLSNVRGLAESGWSGVCVEPAPVAYAKLAQLYKNEDTIWTVNAAITTQDGPIDFWDCGVHLHKNDTSLLSTTRPETIARWKRSGEQFTKTTVRGITFATLLKETGVNHFDFISIDCEGADLDILAQIDLAAVGCRMLCVETNGNNQPFIDLAAKGGMKAYRRVVENMIFVR